MAFSLGKVFSWLKSFLSSMPSPVGGFDLDDVKLNTKGDVFSSLFSFSANTDSGIFNKNGQPIQDAGGNKITMQVLLQVINAQDALGPIFSGLNELEPDFQEEDDKKFEQHQKDAETLLNLLLGTKRTKGGKPDNTYDGAKSRKSGLLGFDLAAAETLPDVGLNYKGQFWSWKNIAEKYFKYALECEAPGADYGAIEDITYDQCSNLIGEYLQKSQIVINANEVKVNTFTLVKPIMIAVQEALVKYYQDIYERYKAKFVNEGEEQNVSEKEEAEAKAEADKMAEQQAAAEAKEQDMYKNLNEMGFVDSQGNPIKKSKHIDVTLKKITATSEVQLLGLNADYSPSETLSDLEEILSQDEFLDTLTEEPQSFAIAVDDDGYDIEQCEACETDPCATLCETFKAAIRAYRNFYIIHWMSHGNDMMKLHLLAEELYGEIIQEIDTMGELLVEKQGTVPQLDFPCDYVPVQQYDFQGSLEVLKSLIQTYIDCIDYAYPNQTSDVQSTLDEWLRYWNKQMNYFIKNQEEL